MNKFKIHIIQKEISPQEKKTLLSALVAMTMRKLQSAWRDVRRRKKQVVALFPFEYHDDSVFQTHVCGEPVMFAVDMKFLIETCL